MVDARRRLAGIFAGAPDAAAARERKAAEFARLRAALEAAGHPATGEFNNARLIAVATYERCVPALRAELERLGNELPAFYAEMKRLENDAPARSRLCPRA
jgi:predicted aminopeptidase